ncbi:MAG: hypothetical protein WBE86_07545 [Candidatus Acidiferrales bacterium]
MDFTLDISLQNIGAATIASIPDGTHINLAMPNSNTVLSAAGFLQPGRAYIATITTPFGTGKQFINPLGDWQFLQGISAACAGIGPVGGGNCSQNNNAITSVSEAGGVVTVTTSQNPTAATLGEFVTISSCSDKTYNGGPFQIQSNPTSNTWTYSDGSTDGGATSGCKWSASGWRGKYGGSGSNPDCATAQNEQSRFQSLGFNAFFEDIDPEYMVNAVSGNCPANHMMPSFPPPLIPLSTNQYSSANYHGAAAQPVMFVNFQGGQLQGIDRTYSPSIEGAPVDLDWFSPNFLAFFLNYWNNPVLAPSLNGAVKSPLAYGVFTDDSDHQSITLPGQFLPTYPRGKNQYNAAFIVAIASPHQSLNNHPLFGSTNPYIYPDNNFYAKQLSTPAPSTCSIASPCSLPDFARFTYGTVATMNTAFGGTSYTTFGSSESSVTNETFGTGNGSTTTFNHTFTSANVSPYSIQVLLTPATGVAGTVDIGGDCPQFGGGCSGPSGTGLLESVSLCSNFANIQVHNGFVCTDSNGDIEWAPVGATTGAIPSWPIATNCSGTQTTAWGAVTTTCLGPALASGSITYATATASITMSNAVPVGEVVSVNYTSCGWDTSCGTGLADEDGRSTTLVGTNPTCIIWPSNWAASHSYTAYDWRSEIYDATSNTWQLPTVSGISGSLIPTFSSTEGSPTINDGSVSWISLGQPVCRTPGNTGSADFPFATNANQTWAQFIEAWYMQYSAAYFSAEYKGAKQLWPDLLAFGTDVSIFEYGAPVDPSVLVAQNSYSDAAFVPSPQLFSGAGNMLGHTAYYFASNYFHQPIAEERIWGAGDTWQDNWGSPGGCNGVSLAAPPYCFKTVGGVASLILRSQAEYSETQQELTLTDLSGHTQFIGWTYWAAWDFQQFPSGIIDNLDNLVDGHEDVSTTVTCSGPLSAFSCGGEIASAPWLGVDAINCNECLRAANALWLTTTISPKPILLAKTMARRKGRNRKIYTK